LFAGACDQQRLSNIAKAHAQPKASAQEMPKLLPGTWACTGSVVVGHRQGETMSGNVTYQTDGSWTSKETFGTNDAQNVQITMALRGRWEVRGDKLWTKTTEAKPISITGKGRTYSGKLLDTLGRHQGLETIPLVESTATFDMMTADIMVYRDTNYLSV